MDDDDNDIWFDANDGTSISSSSDNDSDEEYIYKGARLKNDNKYLIESSKMEINNFQSSSIQSKRPKESIIKPYCKKLRSKTNPSNKSSSSAKRHVPHGPYNATKKL